MGEFSAEWLALREPADRRARSAALTAQVASRLQWRGTAAGRAIRVLDLGTGTGSNVRYLVPQLPMPQRWCLVDRDTDLLRQLPKHVASWALGRRAIVSGNATSFAARGPDIDCQFETRAADLAPLGGGAAAHDLFEGASLVTASALLDLVSQGWLEALVARCRAAGAAVLFVLTYDGRWSCSPEDVDDEWVRGLVNRHQHGAKGFGRALGPDATRAALRLFTDAAYETTCVPSDWILTSADAALQRPLIEGWAGAAADIARRERPRVEGWLQRRLTHLDAGLSQVTVGHQDLGGWPRL